ncbi:hypothetical protein KFU94_62395 [Chloroflexi bacterium TSY]|nr:hypothetical protein [Chloroflexi bacterium TSY]
MSTTDQQLIKIGDTMLHVALPLLDGRMFDLETFRGKKYIIFMWASW